VIILVIASVFVTVKVSCSPGLFCFEGVIRN